MDINAILAVVAKGIGVIETLYQAEQNIEPALKVVGKLITGSQSGEVTDAELTATEATLDGMLDEFNKPME